MTSVVEQEFVIEQEIAREEWLALRDRIMDNGGIRFAGEDYPLPSSIIRRSGLHIDHMADHFNFSYIEDFCQFVNSTYNRQLI